MGTPLLWVGFNLFVLIALALDLGVFHRKAHKIKIREAAFWSVVWIGLAMAFGYFVWHWHGSQRGLEYFTGYVIEKALSIDNLFVFLVIFRTFQVDEKVQHRVLEWGIIGALIMRGVMIAAGAALISRFQWILPVFGLFLVYTGLHMIWKHGKQVHFERNPIFRFASSHLRVTKEYHGTSFFVRQAGQLFATPLLLVLLVVEISDVTFAVDSIPAIFGITRDPFIVFTSNVFAILGLRSLYFLLSDLLQYLRYLGYGLAVVLIFIGVKMVAEPWVHISVHVSLAVVGGILLLATLLSLLAGGPKVSGAIPS
ncbi:MAG TPA: TerC family protein [Candidatus Acidoferrales bacterium]|jgi:tellurite resistance protein TerC|nr:TerC family protein [Candidatus Acidoferrales bacterium]